MVPFSAEFWCILLLHSATIRQGLNMKISRTQIKVSIQQYDAEIPLSCPRLSKFSLRIEPEKRNRSMLPRFDMDHRYIACSLLWRIQCCLLLEFVPLRRLWNKIIEITTRADAKNSVRSETNWFLTSKLHLFSITYGWYTVKVRYLEQNWTF